jgi:hypothetical protein
MAPRDMTIGTSEWLGAVTIVSGLECTDEFSDVTGN